MASQHPTLAQLHAAVGHTVPDVLVCGLNVLFCGINPGLYSAAVGHHFARPGNRFWPALHAAGFTPRLLDPSEERELLKLGLGVTNIVDYATSSARELTGNELRRGAKRLLKNVQRYRPDYLAVLGIGAYQHGFQRRHVEIGRQAESFGNTVVWVLPNPSGLNAHYSLHELVRQFSALRRDAKRLHSRS